jgi:DNA-binding NtrC family response regulator
MLNGSQAPLHSVDSSRANSASPEEAAQFVGVSAALRRLMLQAEIAAPRLQVATIEGEAGTGKLLFAQTIHRQSTHPGLPFRRHDAREWLATETDPSVLSGTVFLDRVDLLASGGQNLLLSLVKMLQSPEGSARTLRFLLLVSSHTSLRQLAAQGQFLPDLAFRLTAVRFLLPPLHEHREDIAPIAQALVDRICRHYQQPTAVLAPGTLSRLLQHPWPGNVRELASILESAILESTTGIIRPASLHLDTPAIPRADHFTTPLPAETRSLPEEMTLDGVIHRHIQLVLELNRGNKLRAARQLGISRSTLYRILAGEASLTS